MAKGEWKASFRDVSIAVASLLVGFASVLYSIRATERERDAKLVEIGVSVLRVDPQKDSQVAGAREWALNLIEANAGVKFTAEARAQLLNQRLDVSFDGSYDSSFSPRYDRSFTPQRPPIPPQSN